jgi:hypothetical protein
MIEEVINILFDGENISFDASLVMYINSTSIPPNFITNKMYENQKLLYIISLIKHTMIVCISNISTMAMGCFICVNINLGYTKFRGSVKCTGYTLHSPVCPSRPLPCVTVCHHIST